MKFYYFLRLMWMETEGMPVIRWIAFAAFVLFAWKIGLLGLLIRLIFGEPNSIGT